MHGLAHLQESVISIVCLFLVHSTYVVVMLEVVMLVNNTYIISSHVLYNSELKDHYIVIIMYLSITIA